MYKKKRTKSMKVGCDMYGAWLLSVAIREFCGTRTTTQWMGEDSGNHVAS
jgi:hypothetical protein